MVVSRSPPRDVPSHPTPSSASSPSHRCARRVPRCPLSKPSRASQAIEALGGGAMAWGAVVGGLGSSAMDCMGVGGVSGHGPVTVSAAHAESFFLEASAGSGQFGTLTGFLRPRMQTVAARCRSGRRRVPPSALSTPFSTTSGLPSSGFPSQSGAVAGFPVSCEMGCWSGGGSTACLEKGRQACRPFDRPRFQEHEFVDPLRDGRRRPHPPHWRTGIDADPHQFGEVP